MRQEIFAILGLFATFWTCGHYCGDVGSGYYYLYGDERIDLTPEPGRIAALDVAGVGPDALADLLQEAGYAGSRLRQHHLPEWWLVELRTASTPPAIANLIGLDEPPRYFFSPIFFGPSGPSEGHLIIMPSVLAKFEREVSDQRIDELIALAGAPGAGKEPFGGLENTYLITNDLRSGIEVLDVANCLAGFSEVIYSEPSAIQSGSSAGVPPDEPREIPALTPAGLLVLSLAVVLAALVVRRRTKPAP